MRFLSRNWGVTLANVFADSLVSASYLFVQFGNVNENLQLCIQISKCTQITPICTVDGISMGQETGNMIQRRQNEGDTNSFLQLNTT